MIAQENEIVTASTLASRDATVEVTFAIAARPEIESVALVGEFNDWSMTATPMVRDGDTFRVTLRLVSGRRSRYKFFVDGERWENDWYATDYEENPHGGFDSVIEVSPS